MSLVTKLFWFWLNDNCDHAGIICPDFELASLQVGHSVDEKNITELGDRLQLVSPGTYIIKGYIVFQWGKIKMSTAGKGMTNVQAKILESLSAHNLNYDKVTGNACQANLVATDNLTPNLTPSLETNSPPGGGEGCIKRKGKLKEGGSGGKHQRTEKRKSGFNLHQFHESFKTLWLARWMSYFPGRNYFFDGPDFNRLDSFIKNNPQITAVGIVEVASKAWKHANDSTFSHCRNADKVAYVCSHFVEIEKELNAKTFKRNNSAGGSPVADRNAGTLNKPQDYAGITEV